MNLHDAARRIRDAFIYDPGHSDLDDEQPISISVTLGDWRKLDIALSETGECFTAPRPLPQELVAVLIEYDAITDKADRGDPEWDFVMRAADYRLIRDFFTKLKPGGSPKIITDPPRPA